MHARKQRHQCSYLDTDSFINTISRSKAFPLIPIKILLKLVNHSLTKKKVCKSLSSIFEAKMSDIYYLGFLCFTKKATCYFPFLCCLGEHQ